MKNLSWILVTAMMLGSTNSFALLEVGESNEILPVGHYRVGSDLQFRVSDGSGTNLSGFFDYPINEESSARALVGFGETNFYAGGSYKWVPYPDLETQPAVGVKVEGILGQKDSETLAHIRVAPIVSKRYTTEYGDFIPYGSLPVGVNTYRSNSDVSVFAVGGTEFYKAELTKWSFGGEIGFKINKSFSYIAGYVTYSFDQIPKLQRRKAK
jgi:hypothetical protein